MSRAEEITSEVRRLVLTCRSMEAQLQQSIPKKTHQEIVTKMQTAIDGLTSELEKTKAELQRTMHLEEQLKALSEQITSQTSSISGQWQSNDARRIKELEDKIGLMVDRTELETLRSKYEELKNSTVPRQDYITLQNQFSNFVPRETFEQMQKSTVPMEQFNAAETRVHELETRIANSIPLPDHDELISKIATMIGEVPKVSEYPSGISPAAN